MSRSATKRWSSLARSPFFTFGLTITGVLLCCLGFLLLAGYYTKLVFFSIKQGQFTQAQHYAQSSQPIVASFNTLTLRLIPDLRVWNEALVLSSKTQLLMQDIVVVAEQSISTEAQVSIESLTPRLGEFQQSLEYIRTTLPKTFLLKKYVTPEMSQQLQLATDSVGNAQTVISSVSQGKQTWVVLLQNSDEVRATGGFPGSYILLQFDKGVLTDMVVEDIYDADGQFQGYISAPPGIREYTSSDRGLRLPDANWWPDFPTSAQTMLQFFALGEKSNIAGVIAVNLDTAKSVLDITGPLWLPDYNVTVNQENVGEVLRAERSDFFPGSTQKKHLLQLTIAQLKQKITQLNSEQQLQLLEAMLARVEEKELQLFSTRPELQELFAEYYITGELDPKAVADKEFLERCQCQPLQLAVVESNVGINKVNKYVSREHTVTVHNNTLTILTQFTNNAAPLTTTELSQVLDQPTESQPRNGNGYLNYHRLLISPSYTVSAISVGTTPVETWDEEVITTASGQELRQIGVLLGVPEKNTSTVTFELETNTTAPQALVVYKQSGIPASTYTVISPTSRQESQVSKNTIFEL